MVQNGARMLFTSLCSTYQSKLSFFLQPTCSHLRPRTSIKYTYKRHRITTPKMTTVPFTGSFDHLTVKPSKYTIKNFGKYLWQPAVALVAALFFIPIWVAHHTHFKKTGDKYPCCRFRGIRKHILKNEDI